MEVFHTIRPNQYPNESVTAECSIKIVAKKDRSRRKDKETTREFIPVFMDDTNR